MERNFQNRNSFENGKMKNSHFVKFKNSIQNESDSYEDTFKNGLYKNTSKSKGKFLIEKSFTNKFLIILAILLIISMICSGSVHAAIQSRPGFTPLVNQDITLQFTEIREMEKSSGPLGLSATIEENVKDSNGTITKYGSYKDTSTTKNGIDVHMIKNSEWGAIVMLALSSYGGGSQSQIQTYSTGSSNYTGVYGLGNTGVWERTMTMVSTDGTSINTSNSYASTFKTMGISSQYYDLYYVPSSGNNASNSYDTFYKNNYGDSAKIKHYGDGIYEMHSLLEAYYPSGYQKYVVTASSPFFVRGGSGYGGALSSNIGYGSAATNVTTRAVVVSGSGL